MSKPEEDQLKISIIVPVYREEQIIGDVVERFSQVLRDWRENIEFIVVDDGSDDKTWDALCKLEHGFDKMKCIRLSRNFGKEAALRAGIEAAGGDVVVTIDGDLQHPPELIVDMLDLWRNGGYDVVEAVKSSRGAESVFSRISARMFYVTLKWLSGTDLQNESDFKLMDRRVVDALCMMQERNLFFRGMSSWTGFSRRKIEFEVDDRPKGRTGWNFFSLVKLATTAISAFSTKPLQIVTILGTLLLIFSIFLGALTLLKWWTGSAIDGFTTVILLQLIVGSFTMISLGIVGTYIGRIYAEVKQRPTYIVAREHTTDSNQKQ